MTRCVHILFILLILGSGCSQQQDLSPALSGISADDLLQHIRTLSSDEFEGRSPGTKGETLTVNYLTEAFKKLGLKPGNTNGTYVQEVQLVGFTATPTASVNVAGKRIPLQVPTDLVITSRRFVPEVKVENSDIIFVGYGVVAPEFGWDDYKDADVRGKTIVMLVNDPAIPDPNDPSNLDESMFKGRAMTYYGRWTYKYEIASEKGAAAAIIVHETGPAGYPFEVVSGSWGRENFDIKQADNNMGRVAIESWIRDTKAKELFAAAGLDFDAMKLEALKKDFRPIPLNGKANFTVNNTLREVPSNNVVAKLEGSDPSLKEEYVVFTGHWDHLGKNETLKGDQIYNGALDNASGTATVLEIAQAFSQLTPAPKRSVLFVMVTAEERGLLGAKHYAENPLYPLNKTLANINVDGFNQWGKTKDIVIVGHGNSTLDDIITRLATADGRTIVPDPEPEKGFFYRSDHFEFAKQGVPALYTDSGIDYIGRPEGYGGQKRQEYTTNDYHKPSDEIKPDWDLSGAVEDARLLFRVGYEVAQGTVWPEWKTGTEFKALREEMLKK